MAKYLDLDGLQTLVTLLKQTFATKAEASAARLSIVYPSGGTATNPGYIYTGERYAVSNPFPGHFVHAICQINVGGEWTSTGAFVLSSGTFSDSTQGGYGVTASQVLPDDIIVVQAGGASLIGGKNPAMTGAPISYGSDLKSAQARLLVYDLGTT